MREQLYAVSLCAALAFASCANATVLSQTTDSQARQQARVAPAESGDDVLWNHRSPSLGWRWRDAFQTLSGSVSIYFDPTSEGAPEGQPTRLRLVARQLDRHAGKPDQISWTDSDRCPTLLRLVQEFQSFTPPRTVIPGMTWPPEFPVIVLDGTSWTLWSSTAQQAERYPAYVEFSSNAGAIADWGIAARNATEGCWERQEPPGRTHSS
ncbi:hypothetical protein [Brevundimonas goettingensis]|uniref:Lipoprotein n=1 Tax=Brevundimonas goettingensis TaxID=2774190 RepID=A0A975BZ41_9CAUL|nr:hypothetical protein [Brevundimonas goettingensis]QTC90463.1 hypothetical protein IFJ75_14425 [Brevundimonas goettingensis]